MTNKPTTVDGLVQQMDTDPEHWQAALLASISGAGGSIFAALPDIVKEALSEALAVGYAKGQADLSNSVSITAAVMELAAKPQAKLDKAGQEAVDAATDMYGFEALPGFNNIFVVGAATIAEYAAAARRIGDTEALSAIDRTALPKAHVVDSLDALEWANAVLPKGFRHFRFEPVDLAAWFALAIEAGKAANKVRGLNGDDDAFVLDDYEANAVEFIMAPTGKVWLNVNGRCRARFGKTNIVVVENDGNRETWRRPAEAEGAEPAML